MQLRKIAGYIFPFVIVFCFLSVNIYAQNIEIKGKVTDSLNVPVSFAIVQLKSTDTLSPKIMAYATTNSSGEFYLKISHAGSYTLYVNSLNFEIFTTPVEVRLNVNTIIKNIILKRKYNQLDSVIVVSQSAAVKEKGDTLSYNLKAFTNGSERNLKDVLNKLPGIEVDENGKIKANGKTIDKLLIDGEDFFGNNHRIATENISAEMVGGVDLLNHYSDNSNVKEIEGSDKTAINVGIKKEYKGKIVGNASAFGAFNNRYKLGTNLFRFNKKLSVSFIGNANNINEEGITLMDYFSMNESIKNYLKNNEISNFSVVNDIPKSLLSNDNVSKKSTQFGALNFLCLPTSKLKISGYSLINNTQQTEQIINNNKFLQTTGSVSTIDSITSNGKFLFNQTKINAEYNINNKQLLNYTLLAEPDNDNQKRNVNQVLGSSLNFINEDFNNRKLKIGNQLSYLNRLNANELLTLNAFYEFTPNKNNYTLFSQHPLFNSSNNGFYQNQQYNQTEWGALAKFVARPKQTIYNLNIGYTSTQQKFNSLLNNLPVNSWNKNDTNITRNALSLNLGILKRKGFFQYLFENKFNYFINNFYGEQRFFYLPKAQAKLEFKPTNNLTFNYEKQLQYPNANQIYNDTVVQTYYTLTANNLLNAYKPVLSDNFSIFYFYLNLYNGTVLFANATFTSSKKAISNNNISYTNFTFIQNIYAGYVRKYNASVNFEQRITALKLKFKSLFSYSKTDGINFQNSISNTYNNDVYFGRVSLASLFKEVYFNFSIGFETQIFVSKYNIGNSISNQNNSYKPFINFEGKVNQWVYHISNAYQYNISGNIKTNFFKTDFDISYNKPKSKFEWYIKANDVFNFNTTQIIKSSIQNNIEQTQLLPRLPGYIGVGLKIKIK